MFHHLRHRAQNEEGFTLIELLVVILIIGILAAIAIPNFLGQTRKAQDASAKSDIRNAVSMMESCFTDSQTYTPCNQAVLTAGGVPSAAPGDSTTAKKGKVVITTAGSDTGYTLTAYSRSSANTAFTITNSGGAYSYGCTPTGNGCNSAWTSSGT